jgi:hypothetical protein
MKYLRNEKGIALITSLLLTLISLAIIMAVMYFITQGIQVSASHKRYRSYLEASYGGVETMTKIVIPAAFQDTANPPANLLLGSAFSSYGGCFQTKLNNPRSSWAGMGCGASALTLDPSSTPDVTFTLQGPPLQPNFTVFAKIVDTTIGNSDTSGQELLESGAGVAYTGQGVSPMHTPATYRIEVQGQRQTNTRERARLTVLYAY